jgi:X-linked retinitis pigmentosa GTPase regulator
MPKVCSFNVIVHSVSCGEEHSCFVAGDGGYVYSMGSNADGKLGIGDFNKSVCNVPTLVDGLYGIKKVSCGLSHTLAVSTEGSVYSWGQSFYGALGIGMGSSSSNLENYSSPQLVSALESV